jgi:hypothetical protein
MIATSVKQEELLKAITTIREALRTLEARVSDKMAKNKGISDTDIVNVRREMRELQLSLLNTMEQLDAKNADELRKRTDELKADITRVEDMIAYYDDSEVRTMIAEVKASIPVVPPSFDATEIMEDIKAIEKKLEEMDKKVVAGGGRGGGVTDMRIRAAFKHIAHTEQPVGDIDGVNTTYTVKNTIWWIAGFTLNGESIAQLPNYTISNRTITFSSAIPIDYAGRDFECKYIG